MPFQYTNAFTAAAALTSACTDSDTVVHVDSTANLPAGPNYLIVIEGEVLLVTGGASLDLTVARAQETGYLGGAAAAHASGSSVFLPLTAGGLDLIRQDLNQAGLESALPSTSGQKQGNTYAATDSGKRWIYDGSAWILLPAAPAVAAGYGMWQLTPPVLADLTWMNQGSATTVAGSKFLSLVAPASATGSIRGLYKAAPGSTPWDWYGLVLAATAGVGGTYDVGLFVSDGTKLITLGIRGYGTSPVIGTYKWTNVTTYSATVNSDSFTIYTTPMWLRIHNDGTNLSFLYSFDGMMWRTLTAAVGVTSFLSAVSYIGIYANSQNSQAVACTCFAFQDTLAAL